MTSKTISKLLLAAALSVAAPALASDATDLVVSSAHGGTLYPWYAANEPSPEKKDAPEQEEPKQEDGRDGDCGCHG